MDDEANLTVSSPEPLNVVVVIPAFRAAKHIGAVLAGIPEFVAGIVVVNDHSPDNTAEVVAASSDRRVHLVHHERNQGVGGAMLTGYAAAVELGADVIVKMDSDDQMDPAFLPSLIEPLVSGEADYTKGNRFMHTQQLHSMPLLRRIGNVGLSFLTKLASGYWGIFDPTNGYTAIRASVISNLDRSRIDRRYFYETSMLIELGLQRAVVRDVYIPARYGDEVSSLSERMALAGFPKRLIGGMVRRLLIQYFIRDFSAFSVLLVSGLLFTVFGMLWGTFHWIRSALVEGPASTGTVMIAVIPIVLGVQFLLQAVTMDIQNSPSRPLHRRATLIRRRALASLSLHQD